MTRISIESDQKEAAISLVKSSLAMQRKVLQTGLERTKARLKAFEKEFGQSIAVFSWIQVRGEFSGVRKPGLRFVWGEARLRLLKAGARLQHSKPEP